MSSFDWVKARFECSLDRKYCAIISRLKADIAEFNELAAVECFRANMNADDSFVVQRWIYEPGNPACLDSSDRIVVICDSQTITARRKGLHVEITLAWNAEEMTCDLLVDGSATPLWRISEMILGEFLFGTAT